MPTKKNAPEGPVLAVVEDGRHDVTAPRLVGELAAQALRLGELLHLLVHLLELLAALARGDVEEAARPVHDLRHPGVD